MMMMMMMTLHYIQVLISLRERGSIQVSDFMLLLLLLSLSHVTEK